MEPQHSQYLIHVLSIINYICYKPSQNNNTTILNNLKSDFENNSQQKDNYMSYMNYVTHVLPLAKEPSHTHEHP